MSTIIHVNRSHIAMNAKDGGNRPVYTNRTRYAKEVEILGPSKCVNDNTQLKCGARAWIISGKKSRSWKRNTTSNTTL